MKGPGLRIDHDVRRVWHCAKCGKTVRTPVHVVAQRCSCSDASWMALQPPVKREPFRPPVREPLPEFEPAPEQPAPVAPDTPIVEEPSVTFQAEEAVPVASPAETNEPAPALAPSITTAPAVPPDAATAEPAASAPAASEQAPVSPPPDDFGAGLSDVPPEPSA
ncbi:MAG: hypothetical protein ACM3U2_11945 [Deltaproteobacteria bacterium]